MTDYRISRRRLLVTAGSGVLGVAVLNTVTGCATDPAVPSSTPTTGGGSATAASSAPAGAADLGDWRRVELTQVSAYLLIRGDEVGVVDLGTLGSESGIEAALKAAGKDWGAVKHIVLTHQHPDHVGSLKAVNPLVQATLYAGADDVSAISSDKPLRPVKDGDEVFGLRIVDTPGHTLGHVSVFDPSTGTLVAGDALRTLNGLEGSDPQYTADEAKAKASVKKLATLDIKVILPGHGDPLTTGAADALQKLAASL
jgi:glyoxylase-like metal-dependent hydrolase (beta-lactamase superfamily II)